MTSEFAIAVHALVYLNHKAAIISSEALAKNICTNPARIRKVMAKLKKAGLVTTKEGVDGGYCFQKDPAIVTLRQVDEAVDVRLVSASWKSGNAEMKCLVAAGMGDIMESIYQDLDDLCKCRLEEITIQDIDKRIFRGNSAPQEEA